MNTENLTYEKAVKRLDEIVQSLDKNDLPLEEALSLFEEGCALTKYCTKILSEAKLKITQAEKE